MLVFVDYEHPNGFEAEYGRRLQAARTWITYRLEDLSGQHCMLVRYHRVTAELLARLDAQAIFISGNATDPARYDPNDLAPLQEIIRRAELPVFGFCGGFQLLATALGAELAPINPTESDDGRLITLPDGRPFEFGYHPVDRSGADHPILAKVGSRPVFRHAHGLHVPEPPDGFQVLASTPTTPVQLAVDDGRRIVGAQFHPEYWTDEHTAGRTLIANFLRWSGIVGGRDAG